MKKILQDLKNGDIIIQDVPKPKIKSNHLIIKTNASLISIGTEKTLLSFGRSNYLDKARQQPEKVQQVINKIRVDGLKATLSAVKSKLDTPLPLGYFELEEFLLPLHNDLISFPYLLNFYHLQHQLA